MFIIVLDGSGSDSQHWNASAVAGTLSEIQRISQHDGTVASVPRSAGDVRIGATSLRYVGTLTVRDGEIYDVH